MTSVCSYVVVHQRGFSVPMAEGQPLFTP